MRDSNTLRLRLVVRRHALPEVRVVFAVQLDTDPTIAHLLEQVNEIIPLESNDWGLEDYAVELRDASGHGFDCLHFQQVSVILKSDEEVFIRPLDTGDRRKRRLTGRDQISSDGKHLIDGIAFGRPRLKTPRDRPSVDIPPLKRRRITYEDEEGEIAEPRLLLTEHGEDGTAGRRGHLHVKFNEFQGDGSNRDEEDEDEDDDFRDEETDEEGDLGEEDDLGDSDLENELRDLQADNEQPRGEEPKTGEVSNEMVHSSAPGRAAELDLQTLDKISALRAEFPTARFESCERALGQHGGDLKSASARLKTRHRPHAFASAMPMASAQIPSTTKTITRDDSPDDSEAESVASMVKHYDQHGFPGGSILAGTTSAQMVEAMRKSGHAVKLPVHTKFDDEARPSQASSRVSFEGGVADETQEDSEGDGENESESEGESESDSESGSESESGSDSGSDSGPEVASSKAPVVLKGVNNSDHRQSPARDHDSDSESESEAQGSDSDDSSADSDDSSADSDDSSADSDDSSADSDDSAGSDDSSDSDGDNANNSADNLNPDSTDRPASSSESDYSDSDSSSDDDSFDSGVGGRKRSHTAPNQANVAMQSSSAENASVDRPQPNKVRQEEKGASSAAQKLVPPGQGTSATQKRNARRRAARAAQNAAARGAVPPSPGNLEAAPAISSEDLDQSVAAKKAALLRRLGMVQEKITSTSPQSLAAETSTVEQLVSDSPKRASQNQPSVRQSEDELPVQDRPAAWRDRIVYRAVECCQDGVELSEPPFPFIQRWDPQQQYFRGDKNKRGGQSKRKQRDQGDFYDEDSQSNLKRRRGRDSSAYDAGYGNEESYANHDNTTGFDDMVLNYDDEQPEQPQEAEVEQAPFPDADDENMPPLPGDLSTLPILNSGEALAGMVVTWKQWLLSKATNWQPQVSSLTGVVVNVLDDNTLEVRLAKRDRKLDHNEKVYDDDGNRVYDKFELPGMDDEGDAAAEQGYRTLDFADMIEPRILSPTPGAVMATSPVNQLPNPEQAFVARDAVRFTNLESPEVTATPEEVEAERDGIHAGQAGINAQCDGGQSMVSETPVLQEPIATPIPEDRRHEISIMIDDAGFRKDVDPAVTDITGNAGLDRGSPSQQLEEMAHDATLLASETPEVQGRTSPQLPSQLTSNNSDSQPIQLQPFYGFSDPTPEPPEEGQVAYPTLNIPPSETGSLHSGRQLDPDFSIDLGHDSLEDLDGPATLSRSTIGRTDDEQNMAKEEADHDGKSTSDADLSDSSIPSLSDMWTSASTIGSKPPTKPITSALLARKPNITPNPGYGDDVRRVAPPSKLAQRLVEKPIEKPTLKKANQKQKASKTSPAPHIKTEHASLSPDHVARAKFNMTRGSSSLPFSVPEGSQVVSLLTSSPEPEIEEHYAEDSIDETYKETSMPTGSGWVKKPRARRGVSVPPASPPAQDTAPQRFTSSQSKQNTDKRTTAALSSLLRAKKKVLSGMV
ncbi:hypothetical protein B0I37DRAFT_449784 [Chaetomium sp. MPI-CAGE-AT-0009]|nr:hypothetical protein B0I37DRAFT_449784 [Chaetomium sp. MPI-CAGE-AT-0009]